MKKQAIETPVKKASLDLEDFEDSFEHSPDRVFSTMKELHEKRIKYVVKHLCFVCVLTDFPCSPF